MKYFASKCKKNNLLFFDKSKIYDGFIILLNNYDLYSV